MSRGSFKNEYEVKARIQCVVYVWLHAVPLSIPHRILKLAMVTPTPPDKKEKSEVRESSFHWVELSSCFCKF